MSAFQHQGRSGRLYRFDLTDMNNLKALSWQGGIYAFASDTSRPLVLAEANNLYEAIAVQGAWALARERGATHAHLLIENDPKKRAAIFDDLIANYPPAQ